ncbi:hypothetical protein [Pseudomonas sp. CC6-YY-74]
MATACCRQPLHYPSSASRSRCDATSHQLATAWSFLDLS